MQFAVKGDIAKLARIVKDGGPTVVPPPWVDWQIFPTFAHVSTYFGAMKPWDMPWSFDFEATLDRRVVCLGLWPCCEPTKQRGLCIPFLRQGGYQYWSPAEEMKVFALCKRFFEDPRIAKVGQNIAGYDTGVTPQSDSPEWNGRSLLKEAWGIDVQGELGDTMVAHALCWPELLHNLALQSSLCTDLGPYKEEVWEDADDAEDDGEHQWARVLERPDRPFRIYNLCDAFATAVGWNILAEVMA